MSMKLRATVLSTLLTALTWSVHAAPTPISLDFEKPANASLEAAKGVAIQNPVAGAENLKFSDATVFHNDVLDNALGLDTLFGSGFIMNAARSLTITALTGDLSFAKLSFNFGVREANVKVTVFGKGTDAGGNQMEKSVDIFGTPGGAFAWVVDPTVVDISSVGAIDRIVFTSSEDVSNSFALDQFSLAPSDQGGGTTPEPASYALVGLALLGAGWASRRRQSA